jgi:hypothetical protein
MGWLARPKTASGLLGNSTVTVAPDLPTHTVQEPDADAAERMRRALRAAAANAS